MASAPTQNQLSGLSEGGVEYTYIDVIADIEVSGHFRIVDLVKAVDAWVHTMDSIVSLAMFQRHIQNINHLCIFFRSVSWVRGRDSHIITVSGTFGLRCGILRLEGL